MKRRLSISVLCIGVLAVALLFAGGNGSATTAGEASTSAASIRTASERPPEPAAVQHPEGSGKPGLSVAVGGAAVTVYKDPATGKLSPIPTSELEKLHSEDLSNAFSTSSEGLVEVPAPGGGLMVNLQSRFQNVQWAVVSTDGTVHMHCGDPQHPVQPRKE